MYSRFPIIVIIFYTRLHGLTAACMVKTESGAGADSINDASIKRSIP